MIMDRNSIRNIVVLHLLLMIYSLTSIFSKMAGKQPFLSMKFILYYCGMIAIMAIYAIGWQQILKRVDLMTAFANKAATVIWGIVWGMLFFKETLTIGKVFGVVFIVIGIVLYARTDVSKKKDMHCADGASDHHG